MSAKSDWTGPSHSAGSVSDERALREIVPEPPARAWEKEQPAIDSECAAFIASSPFAVLATADAAGRCDASPRGGPPGFASVLDPTHIAIPDYTGNRRQDSHRNLLVNPHVGLVFFVPGVKETLRVNGRAQLSTDSELLAKLLTGGAPPKLALVLRVDVSFIHCGKALHRSGLWEPATWPADISLVPARARAGAESEGEVRARWEQAFRDPEQLW